MSKKVSPDDGELEARLRTALACFVIDAFSPWSSYGDCCAKHATQEVHARA